MVNAETFDLSRGWTRHKDETKTIDLEPNQNTTITALDRAVTIPTLIDPYTAATHTVEYSIQWSASSPLNDGGSPQ